MRLLVVSPDASRLEALRNAASDKQPVSSLEVMEGSLSGRADPPVNGVTDVMLLDATHDTMIELDALERVQQTSPQVQTILLAPSEQPDILLRAMRLGVREVLTPDNIEQELDTALSRVQETVRPDSQELAKVYVFASAKGGSGSTFLAANFAHNLAASNEDKSVLLMDLDLRGGNAHLMLTERKPLVTIGDLAREIHRVDASFLESAALDILPNFGILASPEDQVVANEIRATHIEKLLDLARQTHDYVVIDIGRSLGSASIKALDAADVVFPVAQLSVPFIREARRLVIAMKSLDIAPHKIRPLVNRYAKVKNLVVDDLEKAIQLDNSVLVPNDYRAVSDAVNHGRPLTEIARGSSVNKALNKLIASLVEGGQTSGGWLSRVMSR